MKKDFYLFVEQEDIVKLMEDLDTLKENGFISSLPDVGNWIENKEELFLKLICAEPIRRVGTLLVVVNAFPSEGSKDAYNYKVERIDDLNNIDEVVSIYRQAKQDYQEMITTDFYYKARDYFNAIGASKVAQALAGIRFTAMMNEHRQHIRV